MAKHTLYEIGPSAQRITPNGSHSGMDITIQNQGSAPLYIGVNDTVTDSNYGYKLAVDAAFSVELPSQDAIYVYSPSPGSLVSVLEFALEQGE